MKLFVFSTAPSQLIHRVPLIRHNIDLSWPVHTYTH